MPTYGRVKVDTITYDLSGTATDVSVSNIATKASPTFTGTVTVPTPSADDNSTKAASTAYVQTELGDYLTTSTAASTYAPLASPTFTGTVTVPTPTAGDNSTKAASTAFVVASFAPKAAPAFTGNATGVNLTLSGNLTVNGTTTTIDTTTLQVEDKNIEIGKVSSPSDTTADGGGWTLKGATDKTFNWVNSTDAWTSSEHIQVASGKTFIGNLTGDVTGNCSGSAATVTGAAQSAITSLGTLTGLTVDGDVTLTGAANNVVWDKSDNALEFADSAKAIFGTGSDLQLFHDGTYSYIKNTPAGGLYLAGPLTAITNLAATENIARFNADGAVELYHDASKKLETTSSGCTVTGTLAATAVTGDGSGLTNLPPSGGTITATASGAISANTTVILNSDGTVSVVASVAAGFKSEIAISTSTNPYTIVGAYDTAQNKVLVAYKDNSDSNRGKLIVGTISGSSISFGTPVDFPAQKQADYISIVFCEWKSRFVVAYQDFGAYHQDARAFTCVISGTTATSFEGNNVLRNSDTSTHVHIQKCESIERFIVFLRNEDENNYLEYMVGEFNGNDISWGADSTIVNDAITDIKAVWDPTASKILVVWISVANSSALRAKVGTINASNKTASWTNESTITSDACVSGRSSGGVTIAWCEGRNRSVVGWNTSSSAKGIVCSTENSGLAALGSATVFDSSNKFSQIEFVANTITAQNTKLLMLYQDTGNNNYGTANTLEITSGNGITVGSDEVWTSSHGSTQGQITQLSGVFNPDGGTEGSVAVFYNRFTHFKGIVREGPSTNVTADNFLGFSDGSSYSNGQTVTINLPTKTTTQSSLTTGSIYYVQNDGTLATTASTPSIKAGLALSSTSLLIRS